jgi:shikimate kinase
MENASPSVGRVSGAATGCERVLLVGFMGSGKSTVGPLLASLLDWAFLDFDREIERRAGASVATLFRERGEAFFRALEAQVGREALATERTVLASGGGWGAVSGRLAALGDDTLTVWLRVGAETALARSGGLGDRPLLAGPEPLSRARELLEERTPRYREAALHLDSERASPEQLASAIVDHLMNRSQRGGMSSRVS